MDSGKLAFRMISREERGEFFEAEYERHGSRVLGAAKTDDGVLLWVAVEYFPDTIAAYRDVVMWFTPTGKNVPEGAGPTAANCPSELLDMAGPDDAPHRSDVARIWRSRVREVSAGRADPAPPFDCLRPKDGRHLWLVR